MLKVVVFPKAWGNLILAFLRAPKLEKKLKQYIIVLGNHIRHVKSLMNKYK